MRRAAPVVLALVTLAGCGGSSPAQYAGLSEYEARSEVLQDMTQERQDRTSPVFRHRVNLLRLVEGRSRTGTEAWVGIFDDRTAGDRVCIRVTGYPHAFGTDVDVELDHCAAGAAGV